MYLLFSVFILLGLYVLPEAYRFHTTIIYFLINLWE